MAPRRLSISSGTAHKAWGQFKYGPAQLGPGVIRLPSHSTGAAGLPPNEHVWGGPAVPDHPQPTGEAARMEKLPPCSRSVSAQCTAVAAALGPLSPPGGGVWVVWSCGEVGERGGTNAGRAAHIGMQPLPLSPVPGLGVEVMLSWSEHCCSWQLNPAAQTPADGILELILGSQGCRCAVAGRRAHTRQSAQCHGLGAFCLRASRGVQWECLCPSKDKAANDAERPQTPA